MNKKKVISHILGPVLTAIIVFITLPLLTRYYAIDDVGKFSLIQLIANLLFIVFSLGLNQSYVRYYFETENKESLLANMLFIPLLLFIIVVSIIWLIFPNIVFFIFNENSFSVAVTIVLSCFIYIINQIVLHVFRMEEQIEFYSIMMVLPKLLLLIISLFYAFNLSNNNFESLASSFLVSQLFCVLLSLYLSRKLIYKSIKLGVDTNLLKSMLEFGSPLVMGGIGFWLLTGMDKFFIKEYSTYEELGKYAVASGFTAIITLFSTILMNVYNPKVYEWLYNNEPKDKYTSVMHLVSIISFLLWSLSGVFSWIIPIIMPNDLVNVENIFLILIGGPILKLISESTKVGLGIEKRTAISVVPIFVAAFINGCLNYILIPIYGAIGASCASLISFLSMFILRTELSAYYWYDFRRKAIYSTAILFVILCPFSVFYIKENYGPYYFYTFWIVISTILILIKKRKVIELIKNVSN